MFRCLALICALCLAFAMPGFADEAAAGDTYTLRALETSRVYVNGVLLGDDSVILAGIESEYTARLPEGAASQSERVYAFECEGAPDIRVIDSQGRDQALECSNGAYTALRNYDDKLFESETYIDALAAIEPCFKTLLEFVVEIRSFSHISRLTLKDSRAYDRLFEYSAWKNPSNEKGVSCRHENFKRSNFVMLAQDAFCVEVSEDFYCHYNILDTRDTCAYTMYFKAVNAKWLLYDFVIH